MKSLLLMDEVLHSAYSLSMTELITSAAMRKITREISARDKRMAKIINSHPLCTIGRNPKPVTHFEALVESVISQQLAVKAAETIFLRVKTLAGGKIVPSRIVAISESEMRAAGVSGAKFKSINGLADAAITKKIKINKLHEIEDDTVIFHQLTSLWGIGPWTVDMFMMFQLGRLDIWPTGDLGVRRGWEKIYGLKEEITPAELAKKGSKFSPYRSVVAWYCWRALS
jgi:DNA-3-methyladenine glycosylase II